MEHNTDYIHDCTRGIEALDNEDVLRIGANTDSKGNTTSFATQNIFMQGTVNNLQGTRAGIEGADVEDVTRRSKRKSTHFTRVHTAYVDVKKELAKQKRTHNG